MPLPLRMLRRFPVLRRIPARLIGMGFRPEHIKTVPASMTQPRSANGLTERGSGPM
jgi:hypothetical protein